MPRRCVVGGCSNTKNDDTNISIHVFPRDEKLRRIWEKRVQNTRSNWTSTKWSYICSVHFTEDCFESKHMLMSDMGIQVTSGRRLKADAVPSIFQKSKASRESDVDVPVPTKRVRGAFDKREKVRVLEEIQASAMPYNNEGMPQECEAFENIAASETCNVSSTQTAGCQTEKMRRNNFRSVRIQTVLPGLRKGTQTPKPPMMVDTGSQCQLIPTPKELSSSPPSSSDDEYEDSSSPGYILPSSPASSEDMDTEMAGEEHQPQQPADKEPKFIIFLSCLLKLLTWCHCPECGSIDLTSSHKTTGGLLTVTLKCLSCLKLSTWNSQPFLGNMPAGNILLSASILFAGATASKVLRVMNHMNVVTMSYRTFFRHQRNFLLPVIRKVWIERQTWIMAALQAEQRDLVLGGDGRADSPGHSAKYGSYTMIELKANVVLDIQLVQSNECGGSYHMEKTGLERSLQVLDTNNLTAGILVTDRHRQIAKWLRENYPHILHLYDVWHVAKGFAKKLLAASQERDCAVLRPWMHSVTNHMYWCATSTAVGEGDLILAKWRSIVDHVQNKHDGHGEIFPRCLHENLEGREARKKWIEPSSKAAVKLEALVYNQSLCRDILHLSGDSQTSCVEGFHSLLIQFAPKMYVFSYTGMLCRILLAALHFNENSNREQAVTQEGEARFHLVFPKARKGGCVTRRVLQDPTYVYVNQLLEEVCQACLDGTITDEPEAVNVPPPLASLYNHPNKAEAVRDFVSRFGSTK